jgi:hypothetical protein
MVWCWRCRGDGGSWLSSNFTSSYAPNAILCAKFITFGRDSGLPQMDSVQHEATRRRAFADLAISQYFPS